MDGDKTALTKTWRDLLGDGRSTSVSWVETTDRASVLPCAATIFFGVGLYGASIGAWQGSLMALYVGIKLPLIIFATLSANALLNGILAQVLGTGFSFRQTWLALLTAFSVFALIVGSLSPVTIGMALDMPAPDSPRAGTTHRALLLTHVVIIAFAGSIATWRLIRLFNNFTDERSARNAVFALIVGNLFAGAQIAFLFRPIFGQPGLEIEFLRPDIMEGNFYESFWWAAKHTFFKT